MGISAKLCASKYYTTETQWALLRHEDPQPQLVPCIRFFPEKKMWTEEEWIKQDLKRCLYSI